MSHQKGKNTIREIFDFREVFSYYFRRKEKGKKPDINLRIMHWINRISIIIFILAVIILVMRNLILQ
ncbi:MAG: hypothetical protein PVH48_00230 [Cyclobacteriaceae bacterium]